MKNPKSTRALEAMRNRARKIIGSKQPEAQEALLQGLLQGVDIPACEAALADLSAARVAPPRLMMTLLQCQPILFNLLADLNDPGSWRDLASRFYRLQDALIRQSEAMRASLSLEEAVESAAGSESERDTTTEHGEEKAESSSRPPVANNPDNADYIAWLQHHSPLRLFNTFRGVVINASCQLLHLDTEHDRISVELNNELGRVMAADPNARSATLAANERGTVGFPLYLVDHSPGIAVFNLLPPIPVYMDKREGIDVEIQDLVHVDILRGIYRFPKGTLIDFSATGIGLVAPKDDRMKIHRDDVLEFRFQIGMAKVIAEGTIRGLRDQGDRYILGVKLHTNRATQSLLQREVFRVQREIIVALNEEGIPEELLPDIR